MEVNGDLAGEKTNKQRYQENYGKFKSMKIDAPLSDIFNGQPNLNFNNQQMINKMKVESAYGAAEPVKPGMRGSTPILTPYRLKSEGGN